jgi:hypothetical protein
MLRTAAIPPWSGSGCKVDRDGRCPPWVEAVPTLDVIGFRGPQADLSLDHFVSPGEQRYWHGYAEGLGGFEIDHQFNFDTQLNWKVGRLGTLEYFSDIL